MGRFNPEWTFGPYRVTYFKTDPTTGERKLHDAKVTVAIDPIALADKLGPRAARSAGQVSHEAGGLVRVKVAK